MIKENDYVIFRKGEFMRIFPVKKDKFIMIDKLKCQLNNLIGKPFGYRYEIKGQQIHIVTNAIEASDQPAVTCTTVTKDNRNLNDKTENQKLSKEDIERLKTMEDLSGDQIIDRLIENSASFGTKTEFSQEKYIKKKKHKYLAIYEILRPSVRILINFYMQGTMKRKILNMRMDTISQILTYSNLAAHRNCLVVESCKGLLLSAVVERVGGFGTIVNFSPNGSHISTKEILDYMNFPAEHTKDLYNFPLEKSDKVQEYIDELTRKIGLADKNEPYLAKQTKKLEDAKVLVDLFSNKKMDCLIVACKFRPLPIVERLINYLGPNRYFVIYSPLQEPLIECHTYLKQNRKVVHMELSDSWTREYQVLPERTHPKVMMDCCSGFLLYGLTTNEL